MEDNKKVIAKANDVRELTDEELAQVNAAGDVTAKGGNGVAGIGGGNKSPAEELAQGVGGDIIDAKIPGFNNGFNNN